jgi:hypothetical protein
VSLSVLKASALIVVPSSPMSWTVRTRSMRCESIRNGEWVEQKTWYFGASRCSMKSRTSCCADACRLSPGSSSSRIVSRFAVILDVAEVGENEKNHTKPRERSSNGTVTACLGL